MIEKPSLNSWPARALLLSIVLLFGFLFYRSCQQTAKPQDEYGNSTTDTRGEEKARNQREATAKAWQQAEQRNIDSSDYETKTRKPTPLNAATLSKRDSIIRADLGY